MLEKAPKKNIIFIIADSSYVNDSIKHNDAFNSCLRDNKYQVIKVDIISERTLGFLEKDFLNKSTSGYFTYHHEFGLSEIQKLIIKQLATENKNNENIVDIYTPYSLVTQGLSDNTTSNDSTGTHQNLSNILISIEKKAHEKKSHWDAGFYLGKNRLPESSNVDSEFSKMNDFDSEISKMGAFNVKKDVVEFCLKSLNDEKDDEDDEDKKKKNAVKIYIDKEPSNLLYFYREHPDVICVFNDIKMGEEYNKHALGLAIEAANLDSKEEILKIKKTLIKAALEFEELFSNLGEGVYNFHNSQDGARKNDYDRDNFQAVQNLLTEEQKKRVETKFNEAEAKRIMGKASPIAMANSTVLQVSEIEQGGDSSRLLESGLGGGASFFFTPLAKNELPSRRLEPPEDFASNTINLITKSIVKERKGGLSNKLFREARDSSLQVAAGAISMVGSEPIALKLSQHQEVSVTVKDPSGSSVHDQDIGCQSTLFSESSDKVARQLYFSEKNSDFFVTYENGIIKFKIKSGLEDSGDNPATSSGGVSKFDYNKKPNEEEKKIINEFNEDKDININNYLSTKYTKEEEKDNILKLLIKASENTKATFPDANLDKNFFIAVMKVASKERGISIIKEEEFNNCFKDALKEINSELDATKYKTQEGVTLHQIAKFFSAKFQKFSQDNNYITPRTDSNGKLIDIGRRLFRVSTKENIEAFQKMLKSSKMQNDAALRTSLESPPSPVAQSPSSSPTQASVFQSSRTSSTSSKVGTP